MAACGVCTETALGGSEGLRTKESCVMWGCSSVSASAVPRPPSPRATAFTLRCTCRIAPSQSRFLPGQASIVQVWSRAGQAAPSWHTILKA